jgi:hypothetical protein
MSHKTRVLDIYFEIRDTKLALRKLEGRIANVFENNTDIGGVVGDLSHLYIAQTKLVGKRMVLKKELRTVLAQQKSILN